jgi:putative membrane protein
MFDLVRLLYGTLLLRPYVFAFLLVYMAASTAHLGRRRTLVFIPLGYCIAWLSEFSSIHWGFPYGDYFYIPHTVNEELWVFGVPFMDSLSYVFLAYCSYSMAVFLLSPVVFTWQNVFILETRKVRRSWQTLTLGAFLFVLLDIIIDPVALQGYRWFLGQIYGYREVGTYFGIPMSNFGGWLLVGFAMVGALQMLDLSREPDGRSVSILERIPFISLLGPVLYISVLVFNLSVTFHIGEKLLGAVGCLILFFPFLFGVFFTLYKQANLNREHVERHVADFPLSKAASESGSRLLRAALAKAGVDREGSVSSEPAQLPSVDTQ